MNSFRFASVGSPDKRGYVVDSTSRYEVTRNGVCSWAKYYDTLGDGNVQHSAATPFPVDMLPDFLASLAVCLADEPAEMREEMLGVVAKAWPTQRFTVEQVRFALSLKCKDTKAFYYCLQEQKTSTADSKAYDKRWEKVSAYDTHVDGGFKSACCILRTGDAIDRIGCIAAQLEVAEVANHIANSVFRAQLNLADDNRQDANDCRNAWECVAAFVDAYRKADYAKRATDCLRHNLGNRKVVTV
jgi:hypothetical protein